MTPKKGIIILSVIVIIVIAAFVVSVVTKKVIGNKDDNINENNAIDDGFIFTKGKTYTKHLFSLSQNNLIQYKYLWETNRNIPQETKTENVASVFPSYGGDNTNANTEYNKILEENKK